MSTADWHPLLDTFYRKCDLYSMQWPNVHIASSKVAGAPFGGPIAVVRDMQRLKGGGAGGGGGGGLPAGVDPDFGGKPKIRIFTSSGVGMAIVSWEGPSLVCGMSWTNHEQLVVVGDDGTVVLYDVQGEKKSSFSALPSAVKSDGVAEVDFWPTGLVVRTGLKSELWAITSWTEPQPRKLADASIYLVSPPTAMVVLATETKCEVLLATAQGSIVVVDAGAAQDQLLASGPFARMALSPSGALLAAFNDDGTLHLMSTDFKSCLSRFATGSRLAPQQMVWCGNEAILLAWPTMMLLVGLLGDFVKFNMDGGSSSSSSNSGMGGGFHLISEFDGARVVTNGRCEWVARVAEATEAIFTLGATTPAARLFDAQEAFENGKAKADDDLRALVAGTGVGDGGASSSSSSGVNALKEAIDKCLHAAAHEFDYEVQRSLLKAASYGKLVCPSYKSDKFVDMCRVLRVLNAVRHSSVGMPLTFTQYDQMGPDKLVDRLVNRHQHLLAMRVCEYLRIHPERVLVHWACVKVRSCEELSDEKLGEAIVSKLACCPGISFSIIASTAFRHGRRGLATFLLEYEPLASDQVPLLMSMKEDELALGKAIASGDTDLVYLALLHLRKHRKPVDFFALIKDKPLARDLYIAYCKQADLKALKIFYHHLGMSQAAADVEVLEAYQCEEYKDRVIGLSVALGFYEKDKASPSALFSARAVEEELLLLKIELEHVGKKEHEVKSTSVSQLMESLIVNGDGARAGQLKMAMKVGDKRQCHVEVSSLCRFGCWEELWKLGSKKQAPLIGYGPFIEGCILAGAPSEAARYIARLPEYHEQLEWLCNIGYWDQAADVAARERDQDALLLLRDRCRQPMVQQKIERALQLLNQQGAK